MCVVQILDFFNPPKSCALLNASASDVHTISVCSLCILTVRNEGFEQSNWSLCEHLTGVQQGPMSHMHIHACSICEQTVGRQYFTNNWHVA